MSIQEQLNQYYQRVGITPVDPRGFIEPGDTEEDLSKKMFAAFKCKKKNCCRKACGGALFEVRVDGVKVSQEYQNRKYRDDCIPRIVVLSLSKPQPDLDQYLLEAESRISRGGRNMHWPRTLVTVRSLLSPFISCEDESTKEIEKLFVHVRTAKCCSNANGGGQENSKMYAKCGRYLGKELSILKPDVIITQGNYAHRESKRHAFNAIEQVKVCNLERPIAHIAELKKSDWRVYWLEMTFPSSRWMWRWNKEAGPAIGFKLNGVDAKREYLVRYGEAIKAVGYAHQVQNMDLDDHVTRYRQAIS